MSYPWLDRWCVYRCTCAAKETIKLALCTYSFCNLVSECENNISTGYIMTATMTARALYLEAPLIFEEKSHKESPQINYVTVKEDSSAVVEIMHYKMWPDLLTPKLINAETLLEHILHTLYIWLWRLQTFNKNEFEKKVWFESGFTCVHCGCISFSSLISAHNYDGFILLNKWLG